MRGEQFDASVEGSPAGLAWYLAQLSGGLRICHGSDVLRDRPGGGIDVEVEGDARVAEPCPVFAPIGEPGGDVRADDRASECPQDAGDSNDSGGVHGCTV